LLGTVEAAPPPTVDLAAELEMLVQDPPVAPAAPAGAVARRRIAVAAIVVLALAAFGVALLARRELATTATTAPASEPARLVIDFEHSLRDGTFKLWLDDELAVDADLSGRVAKQILGLKLRKGTLEHVLELPPGSHELRVSVAWDGNSREQRTRASFEPAATRKLEIRLGRLLKELSLKWK
jgi:hypothetical protein